MTTKNAKKPPVKPTGAAVAKNESETVWLWAAAIASWNVGVFVDGPKETKWGGGKFESMDDEVDAARFFVTRLRGGPQVVERQIARLVGEGERTASEIQEAWKMPKPAGFTTWAQLAADLFRELGINDDVTGLKVDQLVRWSPYFLEVVRNPKDKAYDERALKPVKPELVASLMSYGGNHDPIKVVVRKKSLVVADGRQRTGGYIVGNRQALANWYEDYVYAICSSERAQGVPMPAHLTVPPVLLTRGVECIVRPLEELVVLKTISNSSGGRTNETVLQEARCAWELEDEGKKAPTIAELRGTTKQTIYAYLSLRKLQAEFMAALVDGSVTIRTGYRVAREPERRQATGWKHLLAVEAKHKAETKKQLGYLPHSFEAEQRARRDSIVTRWLDGAEEGSTPDKAAPVLRATEKAKTHNRLADFRLHLRRLPPSAVVDGFKIIIDALLGDADALKKLPPQLRAGVSYVWQGWSAEQRDGWNSAGVWDPTTIHALSEYRGEQRRRPNDGGMTFEPATPALAGRPWNDGLTLGAAVEAGKLDAAGFWRVVRQEQLALVAGNKPVAPLVVGVAGVELVPVTHVRMGVCVKCETWQAVEEVDGEYRLAPHENVDGECPGAGVFIDEEKLTGTGGEGAQVGDADQVDDEPELAAYSVDCLGCGAPVGEQCHDDKGQTVTPHLMRKVKGEKHKKHEANRMAAEARP